MRSTLILSMILVTLAVPAAYGQGGTVMGTEIFVTHNWGLNGITSGTTYWDNIVLLDSAGGQHTVTFDALVQTGTGTFGPIYLDGNYNIEALWLTATGIVSGHLHPATNGNPLGSEGTHGNGTQNYQGVRIFRPDGQSFSVLSIDYNNAIEPFLLGTSYTQFADVATWSNFGPAEGLMMNQAVWNTYQFVPPDVASVLVDPSTAFFAANTSNNTFTIFSTVTGYTTIAGNVITDPAQDPVIGGMVSITGTYAGSDTASLSNILLLNVSTSIVVSPGADQLNSTNQFVQSLAAPDVTAFSGALGATPVVRRAVAQNGPGFLSRIGSGSAVLDNLNMRLANSNLSLLFELGGSSARLQSIELDYAPNPTTPEVRFRTNNLGNAQIGIIGLPPLAEVWNVAVINPTNTQGTGPFYGLSFGGDQVLQLSLPMGVQPFHIRATTLGTYFYGVPNGTIAAGLTADLATIVRDPLNNAVTQISGVQRLNF